MKNWEHQIIPDGVILEHFAQAKQLDVLMQDRHKFKPLSDRQLELLARQLHRISIRTSGNKSRETIASDKETLKEFKTLINGLNKLAGFAERETRARDRALRYFEQPHVTNKLGDTVSQNSWLAAAPAMLGVAKAAQKQFLELTDNPEDKELGELFLDIFPSPSGPFNWSTELMGNVLPTLYYVLYRNAPKGGRHGNDEKLLGPLYTFVEECLPMVGDETRSAEAIKAAINAWKKANA